MTIEQQKKVKATNAAHDAYDKARKEGKIHFQAQDIADQVYHKEMAKQ